MVEQNHLLSGIILSSGYLQHKKNQFTSCKLYTFRNIDIFNSLFYKIQNIKKNSPLYILSRFRFRFDDLAQRFQRVCVVPNCGSWGARCRTPSGELFPSSFALRSERRGRVSLLAIAARSRCRAPRFR